MLRADRMLSRVWFSKRGFGSGGERVGIRIGRMVHRG